jgi:hypothetical protein
MEDQKMIESEWRTADDGGRRRRYYRGKTMENQTSFDLNAAIQREPLSSERCARASGFAVSKKRGAVFIG